MRDTTESRPRRIDADGGDGATRAVLRQGFPAAHACDRSAATADARRVPSPLGRRALGAALAGVLALGMAGCSGGQAGDGGAAGADAGAPATQSADAAALADVDAMDFEYGKRDLDASYDVASATAVDLSAGTVEGGGASFDAATGMLSIDAAGTYIVSGSLGQGQIVVEADKDADKVQLVLAGASVRNESGPALYVKSADKVFVTLADGTENALADGASYVLADGEDEPNGTVFSKDDLTFNGAGSLEVTGSYRHAVVSKDDLVIAGGTYVVAAAEDGLRGRDCVKVADGDITVEAGGDAVKSGNDEDPARGFVAIDGGTLDLTAGDDGVDAFTLYRVTGGSVTVDAADDAFRSDVLGRVAGGTLSVRAGDDAFHAERELVVDGGQVDVASCYEGYEAEKVYVNGGSTRIVASDDAVNAALAEDPVAAQDAAAEPAEAGLPTAGEPSSPDGAEPPAAPDASGRPNMPGGAEPPDMPDGVPADGGASQRPEGDVGPAGGHGEFPGRDDQGGRAGRGGMAAEASEECLIQVNGGFLVIVAGGDGVDSNGSIEVNGGTVLVTGPTSGADGALDYELEATVNGGTVIMVGAAGMATGFSGGDQPSVLVSASGVAGDTVALVDESGTVLAAFAAEAPFQSVVASAPGLADGASCQVVTGGALVGASREGSLLTGGSIEGGTAVAATASTEGMARPIGGRGGVGPGERGADAARPAGRQAAGA